MKVNEISYQKALDSFYLLATIEGKSRNTIELYEYVLKSFKSFLEKKNPVQATSNDIRLYMLYLNDKKYKKSTIGTHLKELRVFYNFLLAEGHIEISPVNGIKSPKLPRYYPFVLSEEEVESLIKAVRGKSFEAKRNYAILLFLIDTGVRVSELTNLELDDVNMATYTAKVNGKTGERTVHFGKSSAKALSAYMRVRGFLPHETRFIVSSVGEPLGRHSILRMVKRLGEKAGIANKRVSPHTLRHTCATFWIKNGGDPVSLQRQLGQSDPRMIDVYVNLVGRDLAEAHRKYSPLKRLIK